jgi:hypothetical protein
VYCIWEDRRHASIVENAERVEPGVRRVEDWWENVERMLSWVSWGIILASVRTGDTYLVGLADRASMSGMVMFGNE